MYTLTVARDLQGTGGAIWDLKTNPSRGWLKEDKRMEIKEENGKEKKIK